MDTTTRLNQIEAQRLYNELEAQFGKVVKLRQITAYTPAEIVRTLAEKNIKLSAEQVAKMAGRA
jgi:hypothetical protein